MGPKKEEVTGEWRRLHNGELMACTAHQTLFGDQSKKNEMGGTCGTYGGEVHTGF
jgi:hypothetical protein